MNKYKSIETDKIIVEHYNEISIFEDMDKGLAHHNLDHVKNVAELIEVLLAKLGYDNDFIEEAKVAAILHDTGAIGGKANHAFRSYVFAKQYFEDNNIILTHKDLVLDAIKTHSDGFDSDNIMALTLILADKLDIKYTRIAKEGYNVNGIRQMQYIRDIVVDISNNNLDIKFLCDDNIDMAELEGFYFIAKVFKAIIAFSEKLNLNPRVFSNDTKWILFEKMLEESSK